MSEQREAGEALDAEIATRVMGDVRLDPPVDVGPENRPRLMFWKSRGELMRRAPKYSTDIAAAWLVVEKMSDPGVTAALERHEDGEYWTTLGLGDWSHARTAPLAICLAALDALTASSPESAVGGGS